MFLLSLKYCCVYLLQFNPAVIQGFYGHFRYSKQNNILQYICLKRLQDRVLFPMPEKTKLGVDCLHGVRQSS